jgi:TolA-binding protein
MNRKTIIFSLLLGLGIVFSSCKTKSEIRREQEIERIHQELSEAKGDKADVQSMFEELRHEMTRMGAVIEEQAQARHHDTDEIKKEISTLATRIQALEQRAVAEELAAKQPSSPPPPEAKATYENGKKLYEEGKVEEAAEILRVVAKSKGEDGKKAQYLLGEALFASKEYASAALEFREFKKNFPRDKEVPNASFRMAQAFKMMGKKQEARLFFQEVVDQYPKHSVAAKARAEIKKLK